jgi:hypothetical protein
MNIRKGTGQRAIVLALALSIPPLFAACPKNEPRPRHALASPPQTDPTNDCRHSHAFNGERAMDHARKQIEFGPRPPASPQLEKTRAYIVDQLKSYGLQVSLDEFTVAHAARRKEDGKHRREIPGETKI